MPTSASEPVLDVSSLTAGYRNVTVVRDVSLRVTEGEFVCLLGANGVGKTTLLRAIVGQARIRSGTIALDGTEIQGKRPDVITRLGLAVVPQGRALVPDSSVRDNLVLGTLRWNRRFSGAAVAAVLDEAYERFPLLRNRAGQLAGSLSGGEQQMLAIARALAARPRVLVLDEPSLGLAPKLVAQVFDGLAEVHRQGVTVLVAEQNAAAATRTATRCYVMRGGRIVLESDPEHLHDSDHLRAAFLGATEHSEPHPPRPEEQT